MERRPWIAATDGLRVTVRVTPRARRSEMAGIVALPDGKSGLGIRLAAPPVDGAANDALCAFLAKQLGLSRSAVTIRSGAGSRIKQLDISGDAAALAQRLAALS